ncbi:MAG TPA: sensor histidine kinase [Bryobacteraceae bacterium]|nr:sensor histidine kinase [Bryobacteraceae bacterium]
MWRRHLAVIRVMLASSCIAIYMTDPVYWTYPAVAVVSAYAVYAALLFLREPIETAVYAVPQLFLDLAFFILCALHPSSAGTWLTTACYFYLLCAAALLYNWHHVLTMALVSASFFLVVRPETTPILWGPVVLGGALATVLSIQRHAFQERLSAALKRSVMSRYEAEAAREAERQRIGADFHDGPLQSFISFQMRLEIVRKLMKKDSEAALRELVQLQELGKSQVAELRAFIRNMQPVEVDEAGLAASIREVTRTFQRDTGIAVNLEAAGLSDPDRQDTATEVLQVLREALNNVRKHSKASQVTITAETNDGAIDIRVEDDGCGFPFSGRFTLDELEAARLGPKSIKRRIRTLGGQLTVDSRPSAGAELNIRIPA